MKLSIFARAHKPALIAAAIAGTVVISGTASAAATFGWPNVLALFSGQQQMSDGSRVVKVDTKNCQFITALNVTKAKDTTTADGTYYYKVKSDSKLTNEQVTQMVQGYCDMQAESELNAQALQALTGKSPNENTDVIGGPYSVVTANQPGKLSVSITMFDYRTNKDETHYLTFSKIDPNVIVLDKGHRIALSDLKVGDPIAFSYHATGYALSHSETMPPWELNTDEATIAIVIKSTPNTTAALHYRDTIGKGLVEVTPCNTQPGGFCTIEQLNQ